MSDQRRFVVRFPTTFLEGGFTDDQIQKIREINQIEDRLVKAIPSFNNDDNMYEFSCRQIGQIEVNKIINKIKTSNISSICLSSNHYLENSFFELTNELKLCPSLSKIIFMNTPLYINEIEMIYQLMMANPSITSLTMSECGIEDNSVPTIAKLICENKNLSYLNLGQNMLNNISGIIKAIDETKDSDLKFLSFFENQITVENCLDLAKMLITNTSLKSLNLSHNLEPEEEDILISEFEKVLQHNFTLIYLKIRQASKQEKILRLLERNLHNSQQKQKSLQTLLDRII